MGRSCRRTTYFLVTGRLSDRWVSAFACSLPLRGGLPSRIPYGAPDAGDCTSHLPRSMRDVAAGMLRIGMALWLVRSHPTITNAKPRGHRGGALGGGRLG